MNLTNQPQAKLTEMSAFFTEPYKRRLGKAADAFLFGVFSQWGMKAAEQSIAWVQNKRRFKNNSDTKKVKFVHSIK